MPDPTGPHDRAFGLDLLRALAIVLVLAGHWVHNFGIWFGFPVPQRVFFAGDLGVELFFALSGFLIGRILIGITGETPAWRGFAIFMIRRWMRTLPVYFLWLAALLLLYPPKHDALSIASRFLTLTQNLSGPMPPDNYFAVTWSLTIEEWFYLLFGAALTAGARLFGPRALFPCLAIFMLGPLALRLIYLNWSPEAQEMRKQVFFRIDEIAYGVLMAWLYLRGHWTFRHPWPFFISGLTLLGLSWAGALPFPPAWIPALTSNAVVTGCALCLPAAIRLAAAPVWFAGPVHWLATRSYALYIVHLTILANVAQGLWARGHVSAPIAALVAIVTPLVIAELSYRFVEAPILRRRPRQIGAA